MITLTSEFIDENWRTVKAGGVVPVSLFEWDDGDAYTQSSLGVLPGRIVFGALVLDDTPVSDFPIVVRFTKASTPTTTTLYDTPDEERYLVTGERRKAGRVDMQEVSVPRLRSSLASRRAGLLETDLLVGRSVTVIGLGTGGVQIALELAKAGVGNFSLVDPDRLEIGNISRHQAGISFVGRRKVFAARDLIRESNPAAKVDVYPIRAEASNEQQLRRVILGSDLVVCATDNRPSKLFVNGLCVETGITAIFGGAFRRAYGGQILRVRPSASACYHCFVLAMPDTEADREVSSEDDAAAVAYSYRPVLVEPGLALDVAPISIMASKLAIQELIRNEDSSLHILDKDLDAGWYLWVNRPEPGTAYASWPPLSESSDQMTILRWYGVYLDKDLGCPTCGDFREALKKQYGIEGGAVAAPQSRPFPPAKKANSQG